MNIVIGLFLFIVGALFGGFCAIGMLILDADKR